MKPLTRHVPLPNPPEVLAARARDVLARLGYRERAADSAAGFLLDSEAIEELGRRDASPTRWEKLRTVRPGLLGFFYRESTEKLVAESWTALPP